MQLEPYDTPVPLRPSRRLPRKFARRVTPATRRLVEERLKIRRRRRFDRWKTQLRRLGKLAEEWRSSLLRWCAAAVVAALLTGTGFMLFSPILEVREIRVTRLDPRLDIEHVQEVLSSIFGRHMLFLSQGEIVDLLRQQVPDIERISMRKEYPALLHIRVELDPLVARLLIVAPDTPEEITASTGATLDFLTRRGFYVTAPETEQSGALPAVRLVDWGVRPLPGTRIVDPALLERLSAAESTLVREFGREVKERTVYLRGQEFHLALEGQDLWFDMRSPLDAELQRLRVFLQHKGFSEAKEYIDLRIADRVVYK